MYPDADCYDLPAINEPEDWFIIVLYFITGQCRVRLVDLAHSPCSHQCRICGVVYECESDKCGRAFQYGKCVLCGINR